MFDIRVSMYNRNILNKYNSALSVMCAGIRPSSHALCARRMTCCDGSFMTRVAIASKWRDVAELSSGRFVSSRFRVRLSSLPISRGQFHLARCVRSEAKRRFPSLNLRHGDDKGKESRVT